MSSTYREPDQWALQHRAGIQITAAVVGLITLSVMFYPTSQQINSYALFVGFTDLMLYSWLSSKWNPLPRDFLDYLESRANQDEQTTWLNNVKYQFSEIWGLQGQDPIKEMLANE